MCTARHRAVAKNKKSEQNIKNCLTMLVRCDIIFFVVEVWLSLVEYFVRDEGVAGSNPVTSTIPRVLIGFEMFYKHSRFFIAFLTCTSGKMNIYALSCMYRNIVFGQFFKVGYFNIAYAIIVNCELLNGFTVNLFGLMYFNFFNQFV